MMGTWTGGRKCHWSEETQFTDLLSDLSVEGLYGYIEDLPDDEVLDHTTFAAGVIGDYIIDTLGAQAGERGSDWFDQLKDHMVETWEAEDNELFEYFNHGYGKTAAAYKTLINFKEFCNDIAKH